MIPFIDCNLSRAVEFVSCQDSEALLTSLRRKSGALGLFIKFLPSVITDIISFLLPSSWFTIWGPVIPGLQQKHHLFLLLNQLLGFSCTVALNFPEGNTSIQLVCP